jgi:hypothetical protein
MGKKQFFLAGVSRVCWEESFLWVVFFLVPFEELVSCRLSAQSERE